ncbi:rhamnan synthesis F family protein [Paenibacillus sp. 2003]|uniref:rhamnan synthesis F family protein n=1 Tax=Paenibacillus sp. 2003 TaxID=2817761 RepID=UPI002866E169|nr:rhamnan synthesis F family protein [Paenibacillus sp. 2003]MDR6720358.1 rhamnosyltransferase [Paenibacillus sp. 2003]
MKFTNLLQIKRLGIYFFYDKDGVVDDYNIYFLQDLMKNLDDLLVICNGKLTPEGRMKLSSITDKVIVRENKGFDVWAYKEGMEYFGWDKICNYDELVLVNFTMYGPLYPFKEMFDEMNLRDLDFWGITTHHGYDFDPFGTIKYGYIPEHIQSSFICVRNEMLRSFEFQNYWDKMPNVNSYGEAVGFHEAIFTKSFSEFGYKWEVYVDTSDLKKHTYYPLMLMPLELVKNRRCPVIKRKCFFGEYNEFMTSTTGEPAVELYNFIQKNLSYDLDLIWENLLRVENMADIKNRMHLNVVLPDNFSKNNNILEDEKIALVMHVYYEDLIEKCFEYAKSMPPEADVYITTSSEKTKELIEHKFAELKVRKVKAILIENRGRDVSSLLVGAKDIIFNYDYVCFAHDKKTKQFEPYTIGESFSYKCFENILGSSDYVYNILQQFRENPRLGLLTPPPPNHAAFYGVLGTEWGANFENTKELAERLKINVNIDNHKEPISPLGTMFWFRPDALKTLLSIDWNYEDFPEEPNDNDGTILHAIERLYGFVAQHEGYYPSWVMSDSFARLELTNSHFMLRELNLSLFGTVGHHYSHVQLVHTIWSRSLKFLIKQKMKGILKRVLPKFAFNLLKKVYWKIRK